MNANPTDKTLVEIRDIRTWFPIRRGIISKTVGYIKAVDGASLTIDRNETLGLVGESGCGKTTLGRTIVGLEKAREGVVLFENRDLLRLSAAEARKTRSRIQMIFQDPYASLNPRMTVMDIVTEGLIEHGLLKGRREDEAERLLKEVGMTPDALYRYPFEFSGGQRQRISLARAMSLRPSFVVCDEAVSALDVSVQSQVLNLLMDLKAAHGLSYLFISHDLGVIKHISDRVAVMYLGRIIELGRTEQVMENPLHPYTQALLSAVMIPGRPRGKKIVLSGDIPSPANPPPGCPFHTRCPMAIAICKTAYPAVTDEKGHTVVCHLYGNHERRK